MGNGDPYREVRRCHDLLALGLPPELQEIVRNSPDPLKAAAHLAVWGDAVDPLANSGLTEDGVCSNMTGSISPNPSA